MLLKRVVSLLICVAVITAVMPCRLMSTEVDAAASYSGEYVDVGGVTLPLAEYMPGSFFTKNGYACTNHATADCVSNGSDCNCMRYYPTGDPSTCEVDLLAVQCYGFSRLVFYKCFGFIDHSINASRYYNVGTLYASAISESSVKSLLMKAAPGAHVRLARGHSVSILSMDDTHITIYHANSGGDGVASASCVVSTICFTWADFATYARAGIEFVHMPNVYPGWINTSPDYTTGKYVTTDYLNLRSQPNTEGTVYLTIPIDTEIQITEIDGDWGKTSFEGYEGWVYLLYTKQKFEVYITTDALNLRAEPNTNCTIYLTIPKGTVINVTDTDGNWGKTSYGGYEGWVSLDYAQKQSQTLYITTDSLNLRSEANTDCTVYLTIPVNTVITVTEISGIWGKTSYGGYNGWVCLTYASPYEEETASLTPVNDIVAFGDDGFLHTLDWGMTCRELSECFEGQEVNMVSLYGDTLTENDVIGTGTTVQLVYNGQIADSADICVAGDMNGNGSVNSVDYLIIRRALLGQFNASAAQLAAADINGDGKLTAVDYTMVKNYCLNGNESIFENYM